MTGLRGLNVAVYVKHLHVSTWVYKQYSYPSTKNSTAYAWVLYTPH